MLAPQHLEEEPDRYYLCLTQHLVLASFLPVLQVGRRFLKNVSDLLGSDFVGIEISTVTKALIVPEVTETTVLHSLIVLQAVEGAVSMASFFPEAAALGRFCLQRLRRTLGSETASWSPNVEMCLVGSRSEGGERAAGEGRGQRSDGGGFRDTEEGHGLSALYGAQEAMEAEMPCSRAQGGARG